MLTQEQLLLRTEDQDLEVKAAQGREGTGEVPASVWETYSAMANTEGGIILLGVGELDDGQLRPLGIEDVRRVQENFWSTLNNPEKVNRNLLSNSDVTVLELTDLSDPILEIRVPRALRRERPIYIGENPLTGTFRRNYEGDFRCPEHEVRRMIAEAEEDARDSRILTYFDLNDLDEDSLDKFRNEFRSTRPSHPWVSLGDKELLRQLGGYRRARETGEEGLTLAGLLMFGRFRPIHDAVGHYALDYQEKIDLEPGERWSDRLTTDGTWSGNLFDFYRMAYRRLTRDLRVPFRMDRGGKRIDESGVHEALREALVNSLIHADYDGRVPIRIEKFTDRFVFRNPGGLRLPRDRVLEGGVSDCRNPNLQKMFQMIGASEKAGSGIPKIFSAWEAQQWRQPELREEFSPEQVELELRMISLFPPEVIEELVDAYPGFDSLSEEKRLAVITARTEGRVTNRRLRELVDMGRYDVTVLLRELVTSEFLQQRGRRGGTYYELADARNETLSLFASGRESQAERPEIEELREVARPVSEKGRVPREVMKQTILDLCRQRYLSREQLADLLDRSSGTLQTHYLKDLVQEGRLELRFPNNRQHPRQAYRTSRSEGE